MEDKAVTPQMDLEEGEEGGEVVDFLEVDFQEGVVVVRDSFFSSQFRLLLLIVKEILTCRNRTTIPTTL